MTWADYRQGANKTKVHLGFDIGRGIPQKFTLTDGKGDERAQAERFVAPGQTGVYDRGCQCYKNFDDWQDQGRHFICRIKANSRKTELRSNEVNMESHVFYDAVILLGTETVNQTNKEIRVVG